MNQYLDCSYVHWRGTRLPYYIGYEKGNMNQDNLHGHGLRGLAYFTWFYEIFIGIDISKKKFFHSSDFHKCSLRILLLYFVSPSLMQISRTKFL
ncbi:hypothetical protein M6B38_130110 [Iris pallida]|uniref:Uncharacterized protein n=1 Tax=Iris pallida TaxID=29817 RepID=A0AAX6G5H8_IRIPA|nr:hypothetical protein M6B38_130110 [Iris pallida]